MKDLHDLFEAKKIENEFQNRENHPEGVTAEYQPILDELKLIKNKMRSYAFQVDQLSDRLRHIQRNYYDDMTIIDISMQAPPSPPWRSVAPFPRSNYEAWTITPTYIATEKPSIIEVAIRKAGNEKNIKILDNICRRILNLNDMAKTLTHRRRDLKKEMNVTYGQFVPTDD